MGVGLGVRGVRVDVGVGLGVRLSGGQGRCE